MKFPWRHWTKPKTTFPTRLRATLRLEVFEDRTLLTVVAAPMAELQINANVPHLVTTPTAPDAGVDENGNFDVVFVQNVAGGNTQISVRRFKANGTAQTTNPTVVVATGTAGSINPAKIAVRKDGSFVVAYVGASMAGPNTIFVKRFSTSGSPLGTTPLPVPSTGVGTRAQVEPDVAVIDATGEFFVSWTDQVNSTQQDIRIRAFNTSGAPVGSDVAVASTANVMNHGSSIAVRPANSSISPTTAVVSYTQDGTTAGTSNVFVQRLNTVPAPIGGAVQVNATAASVASQSQVAIDASLNFVVAWTDSTTAGNSTIRMRRFNKDGVAQTPTDENVDVTAGNHSNPDIAKGADDGRYIITYLDSSSNRIAFQEFASDGRTQGGKRMATDHASTQANPAVGASHKSQFVFALDDNFTTQNEPWAREFNKQGQAFFAVGGSPGRVQIRKTTDGSLVSDFTPYGPTYTGPVSVAFGDVNGDGFEDLITGATAGNPDVRIFDGKAIAAGNFNPTTNQLLGFFPYGVNFNIGANVAAADVNGDGFADIITGATGGNPQVKVYSGQSIANGTFTSNPEGNALASFFAYGQGFNIGVNVAGGDVNNDGFAEVVTGATLGNPHVKVYNGKAIANRTFSNSAPDASLLASFFAYNTQFNVGVSVAVGSTKGNGFGDIITGASVGNPHVKVFDGSAIANGTFNASTPDTKIIDTFFAYDLQFNIGVHVGAADFAGTGKSNIITGAASGAPHYRVVAGNATGTKPAAFKNIESIPSNFMGGVNVSG